MKKLILFLMLLAFPALLYAQGGNAVILGFDGVPSGSCAPVMLSTNNLNGAFYNCFNGTWQLVAGAGDGISQIDPGENVGPTVTFSVGALGTDFNISNPAANQIQHNLPTADATHTGKLSSTDWSTFNNKKDNFTFDNEEGPAGILNGVNVTFTLNFAPFPATSLRLVYNGLTLRSGAGNDFTISGNTITMLYAPTAGSNFVAWYTH